MSFVIFSTISILAVIYFAVMPKNLNALELAMIMIVVVFVDSNFMDIAILNLHLFKLPDNHADIFTFYLTFTILYPIIVTWSIDRLSAIARKPLKLVPPLFAVLVIVGFESLTKYVKAVKYIDWNWKLDFVQWFSIWLVTYFIHLLYKKLIMKELKQ
ncbi:hypothetical protein [Neobacillus mesonae]|uniref:hypothetical protein n=1 Tax=Neobacillus mesonae TaxID=1193713 RepID=UPI002E1C0F5E|nr:hypothetical protein [Neobacillus mesonae]